MCVVYRDPSEAAPTKFDFIVCAHKAINPSSAPPLFKNVADDNTTFVIMQNGVGNEEPFRKEFPKCTIISGVVWVGGVQRTPGIITHTKNEDTKMGLYPNPDLDAKIEQERLDKFVALFRNGGTTFSVVENVQIDRWEKCVWNAAWNPLTALTQVDTTTWLHSSPEADSLTRQLMREMITVAQHCDVPLKLELADELIEKVLNVVGAVYSSMYVDMKERRAMEVEVILGTAVKKAREFGIEVPVLGMVYALVNAADLRIRTGKGEHP
jgi:2-dehydropantoate 2-reductase